MTIPSRIEQNKKLIETFYTAFQNRDGDKMAEFYAPNAHFEDAVFKLEGSRVGSMWKMLCQNGNRTPILSVLRRRIRNLRFFAL